MSFANGLPRRTLRAQRALRLRLCDVHAAPCSHQLRSPSTGWLQVRRVVELAGEGWIGDFAAFRLVASEIGLVAPRSKIARQVMVRIDFARRARARPGRQ